jgi:hypothetical protein
VRPAGENLFYLHRITRFKPAILTRQFIHLDNAPPAIPWVSRHQARRCGAFPFQSHNIADGGVQVCDVLGIHANNPTAKIFG